MTVRGRRGPCGHSRNKCNPSPDISGIPPTFLLHLFPLSVSPFVGCNCPIGPRLEMTEQQADYTRQKNETAHAAPVDLLWSGTRPFCGEELFPNLGESSGAGLALSWPQTSPGPVMKYPFRYSCLLELVIVTVRVEADKTSQRTHLGISWTRVLFLLLF
jgi:hypothetical protein